jgi:L,D-transpeptidase ErfK/SrfK
MIKYPMRQIILVFVMITLLSAEALAAGSYAYSDDKEVVGLTRRHNVEGEETLYEIARKYNIGFNEVAAANPGIKNPFKPGAGKELTLPTKWILPSAREGLDVIVNIAEMRLYRLFSSGDRRLVSSYPIGVAIEGFPTPLGSFSISGKLVKPAWYVPDSVRREQPELPEIVPPGDENPLGEYALRLSDSHYFIHGTNKPYGIGMRVSHGCIRLYPEDIVELYSIVGLGSSVRIVYEPVKAGLRAGGLFIEAHEDYLGKVEDMEAHAHEILRQRGYDDIADFSLVKKALDEKLGIPVLIGRVGEPVSGTVEARAKETPEPEAPGSAAN